MAHAQDADFEAEVEKAMAKLRQEMGGVPTWVASAGPSRPESHFDPADRKNLPEFAMQSSLDAASRYSPLHVAAGDAFAADTLHREQRDAPAFGRRSSKADFQGVSKPAYVNIAATDAFFADHRRESTDVSIGRRSTRGSEPSTATPNVYPVGLRGRLQSREYDNAAPGLKRELDEGIPLFHSGDVGDAKANKKAAYAAELQQQIEEKNARKKLEKVAAENSPGGSQHPSAAQSPPGSPQLDRMAMPANQGADAITKAIQSGHTFSRYACPQKVWSGCL
jgi:hypothetical protein